MLESSSTVNDFDEAQEMMLCLQSKALQTHSGHWLLLDMLCERWCSAPYADFLSSFLVQVVPSPSMSPFLPPSLPPSLLLREKKDGRREELKARQRLRTNSPSGSIIHVCLAPRLHMHIISGYALCSCISDTLLSRFHTWQCMLGSRKLQIPIPRLLSGSPFCGFGSPSISSPCQVKGWALGQTRLATMLGTHAAAR